MRILEDKVYQLDILHRELFFRTRNLVNGKANKLCHFNGEILFLVGVAALK